jgi:hypothetical protein
LKEVSGRSSRDRIAVPNLFHLVASQCSGAWLELSALASGFILERDLYRRYSYAKKACLGDQLPTAKNTSSVPPTSLIALGLSNPDQKILSQLVDNLMVNIKNWTIQYDDDVQTFPHLAL